ncbi:DUF305 domain-containing protein (plasmid) [Azospirillum humicireducens]|uniref:DUF305 domain-containing protein n=1 Tax=Azospirillum humicireducens TaxID=1226968 RepID=A0A2R4VQP5_9PROT|nr:DUF305 domain-containing protein [Azospirillum humicireducens]AWB06768.1 DUF305 domain-containing protein [Azospirillum humicireducens]
MTTIRCCHVLASCAAALALIAGTALAQSANQPANQSAGQPGEERMQGHPMPSDQLPQDQLIRDPASQAYMDGMRKMNRDMRKPMTGDADQDFARMMLPHHHGAVDMAKVQLKYGKDPELRALARKIVDDQAREIAQLQDWLKRHPATPAQAEGGAAKTPK